MTKAVMKSLVYCAPPQFPYQCPSLPPVSSPQISIKQVSGYLSSMVSPALPPAALAELQQQFLTMAAAHAKDIPEKDVQVSGLQPGVREVAMVHQRRGQGEDGAAGSSRAKRHQNRAALRGKHMCGMQRCRER